jgi:hypothetical protein
MGNGFESEILKFEQCSMKPFHSGNKRRLILIVLHACEMERFMNFLIRLEGNNEFNGID